MTPVKIKWSVQNSSSVSLSCHRLANLLAIRSSSWGEGVILNNLRVQQPSCWSCKPVLTMSCISDPLQRAKPCLFSESFQSSSYFCFGYTRNVQELSGVNLIIYNNKLNNKLRPGLFPFPLLNNVLVHLLLWFSSPDHSLAANLILFFSPVFTNGLKMC